MFLYNSLSSVRVVESCIALSRRPLGGQIMPFDIERLQTALDRAADCSDDPAVEEAALWSALKAVREEAQKPQASQELHAWLADCGSAATAIDHLLCRYLAAVQLFDCGCYTGCDRVLQELQAALGASAERRLLIWSSCARMALLCGRIGRYGALRALAVKLQAEPDLPPRLQAEVEYALAAACDRERDALGCRHHLRRCDAAAQGVGGSRALLAISGLSLPLAQASLALLEGNLQESAARHQEAARLAEELGLRREQAQATACQARLAFYAGRAEDIEPLLGRAEALAEVPGACWHVLLLCHLVRSQHALQSAMMLGNIRDGKVAARIQELRQRAEAHAREAYRISKEKVGVPRERFRQARNLADILARACDSDAVVHQDGVQMRLASSRLEEAQRHLIEALNYVALVEEPFARALAHHTAAVIHDHHYNLTIARQNYEASLEVLRQYAPGYRLLQLQLEYGNFLRRRLQLPELRCQGLALLAEGKQRAAERCYADLVHRFEVALADVTREEWLQALAQASPHAARSAAFRLVRQEMCRGLRHDLLHALDDLAVAPAERQQAWKDHLRQLVDQLTQLAGSESVSELRLESYDLHDQVAEMLGRRAGTAVETAFLNLVPTGFQVHADRLLLGQALENLVHNAVKAMHQAAPPGRRSINVAAQVRGDEVVIDVTDTAGGVPEAELAALFSGRRGIGLAFADFIARWHGGRAALAWTRVGEGSRFILAIPHKSP